MGLRINTNVSAINAQNNLSRTKQAQEQSLQRLSSGLRINKSADDAAGLAISENLKTQIRSNQQAERNANDGVSFLQVAEGGLNEVGNILVRLRELSVQAASDTIGDKERQYVDIEVQQMKDEVQRISQVTRFNNKQVLNGQGGELELQIGSSNDIFEDRLKLDLNSFNTTASTLGIDSLNFKDKSGAQEAMGQIDNALNIVNANRASLGAVQNRLQSTINNLQVTRENLNASNSRIRDADIAQESSEFIKNNILQQASISVLAQANATPKMGLNLLS